MESWEDLILQWTNCLLGSSDNVVSVEELVDCKIFSQLISRIVSLNCKDFKDDRDMVSLFLKSEYPRFKFNDGNSMVENLCFSSLILCRLSLEPIFHKALCMNLKLDYQVKVKSILESVYPLGKDVTNEDLCKIFSHLDKSKARLFPTQQKFILKEFLNSPATRSAQNDNQVHQMSRQIRNLRADLETALYEKSELIEDLKNQKKKFGDLELKLQQTELELKNFRRENVNTLELSSHKSFNDNLTESLYRSELQSLEKYVADLQNDNCKLEDEKQNLINEISTLKQNLQNLQEKNFNNEQSMETMLSQIEKKDDELSELKSKYEELCNYLKDRSSIHSSNYSFEVDDRIISELSLNRSETLSSVIEVQLQDTKREMNALLARSEFIDKVLTVYMEEFEKKCVENLKIKMELVQAHEINSKWGQKDDPNELILEEGVVHLSCHCNDTPTEVWDEPKFASLILNPSQEVNLVEVTEQINELNIARKPSMSTVSSTSLPLTTACSGVSYQNGMALAVRDLETNWPNDHLKELFNFTKSLLGEIAPKIGTLSFDKCLDCLSCYDDLPLLTGIEILKLNSNNPFVAAAVADDSRPINSVTNVSSSRGVFIDHKTFEMILKFCLNEFSKNIQNDDRDEIQPSDQLDPNLLQSEWDSLNQSVTNCLKIHKVLVLLDKSWCFILDEFVSLMTTHFDASETLKKLFIGKDEIEKKIKSAYHESFQNLSLNLIAAVQFVTILSGKNDRQTPIVEEVSAFDDPTEFPLSLPSNEISESSTRCNLESTNTLSNMMIEIKAKMDDFCNLLKLYQEQERSNFEAGEGSRVANPELEKTHDMNRPNDLNVDHTEQVQDYLKEVHEKYETKLEKMKEKMKLVYNNQIAMLKKEQENIARDKLNALQSKLESQCHNHVEELKKYKRHISELTTQLWDVGEKLIIEKQKKEDSMKRLNEFQMKLQKAEVQGTRFVDPDQENQDPTTKRRRQVFETTEDVSFNKFHNVRGFQMMENAFKTEDEEGEVFDTTYLADMQRPRTSLSSVDINRLSILQMRNSKCQPHLKSSYPAEMQFHPVPLTEDQIKNGTNGSNPEEFLNDSLSQSLLTGKKVKRKDRARNASETPRHSRRFSNIFRKPRSSTDQK